MSDIYLSLTETPSVVTLSQPVIASSVAATVTVGNTVTVALDANSLSALENVTVTVGAAVSVSNFPASQVVTGTVALDSASLAALENVTVTVGAAVTVAGFSTSSLPPSTVTVGNSVTIGNFPSTQTIAGTVTANASNFGFEPYEDLSPFGKKGIMIGYEDDGSGEYRRVRDNQPLPITINPGGTIPAISGTVTANTNFEAEIGGLSQPNNGVQISFYDYSQSEFKAVADSTPLPISGTVTANNPNGALTTRFGSVTTANTAQITSAVTNTSRKYLLAQNISAGTVTIGIGFSPTTTQGIQLTAGGGLTFDAFCPTGAVYWLGAVTGAAFTILEG